MRNATFFKIFVLFSAFYLLVLFLGYENLDPYLKPALIPLLSLGAFFYRKFPSQKILLTALLFSWIGDVILLFTDISEIYFILGLIAFLFAHITYCVLFNKQKFNRKERNKPVFITGSILIAVYLVAMISFLMPSLGDLKLPVIVYASIISIMFLFAFNGLLTWKNPGNQLVFFGALIFLISDSILAINKFYFPIYKSSFFIMFTYLVAQYLIVIGILKLNPKKAE